MFHKTTVIGRLGNDPELRFTPQGKAVCSFSLAAGQKDKTVWYRVTCWEKTAEIVNQYLAKGKMAHVEGVLAAPSVYQTKSGEYRASLDLTAHTVTFLSPRGEGAPQDVREPAEAENIPF